MKTKKNISLPQQGKSIIALLTDFGTVDHYVAAMKGRILSIDPSAVIIDITHEVEPHNVRQGGYLLWSASRFFPKGTIFIGIVDPGVGTERNILAIQTPNYSFLFPQNGLANAVLSDEPNFDAFRIDFRKSAAYFQFPISATFHGRDVFAPLAAYLSLGVSIKEFGERVELPPAIPMFMHLRDELVKPGIVHIDHFGNIITNIRVPVQIEAERAIKAISIGHNLVSRWTGTYADAPDNTPCLIVGSSGLVEISIKNKRAAAVLGITLDTPLKMYWQ
jgi:S-adenosyl-L-methionine hydrolase (adenosine-forming)